MTTPLLLRRLEALEAGGPEQAVRVVTRNEEGWTLDDRSRRAAEFSAGLPPHRGLTVVIRRFGAVGDTAVTTSVVKRGRSQ
jgi:hypothetical protein